MLRHSTICNFITDRFFRDETTLVQIYFYNFFLWENCQYFYKFEKYIKFSIRITPGNNEKPKKYR